MIKISKYGQALGVWDLKVGRTEEQGPLQLHPTHKDNKKLLSIVTDERIKSNQALLLERLEGFLKELISKEYPPVNEAEKEELEAYIGSNIIELMTETLITFKLAKRGDLEREQAQLKKEMLLQPGLPKPSALN